MPRWYSFLDRLREQRFQWPQPTMVSRPKRILVGFTLGLLGLLPLWTLLGLAAAAQLTQSATLTIGGASQIGGVLLVVVMLSRARKAFGRPSWLRSVAAVLANREQHDAVRSSFSTVRGLRPERRRRRRRPIMRSSNPRQAEGRLTSLENAVENLWGAVERDAEERTKLNNVLRDEINKAQERQERAEARLYRMLRETALGDEGLNRVGVALFLQGIACATWPKVLADTISGIL